MLSVTSSDLVPRLVASRLNLKAMIVLAKLRFQASGVWRLSIAPAGIAAEGRDARSTAAWQRRRSAEG